MDPSNGFSPAAGSTRDYLAFDLEIAKIIPDGVEDWMPYRPFGISCAATLGSNETPTVWHGSTPEGNIADRMSQAEVIALVIYLEGQMEAGKTILTWNGAGFDFSVLAEESGMWDACKRIAAEHVDMMFHLFCLKGFGIGLDKAAKGMALRGKPAGMDGAQAPRRWQAGQRQEVLDYVCQDVITTMELCGAVETSHALQWVTSKGTSQRLLSQRDG